MVSKSCAKYIRISPRKLRLVADIVRGKRVDEALAVLPLVNKRGAQLIINAIKSALANAQTSKKVPENLKPSAENLFISRLLINEAPRHRWWKPGFRGRPRPIRHRASYILVELDEIGKNKKQ